MHRDMQKKKKAAKRSETLREIKVLHEKILSLSSQLLKEEINPFLWVPQEKYIFWFQVLQRQICAWFVLFLVSPKVPKEQWRALMKQPETSHKEQFGNEQLT